LFGLEYEAASFVEIDAAGTLREEVSELDGLFKGVAVERVVGLGGIGTREFEVVAEFGEEKLVVGAFGCA